MYVYLCERSMQALLILREGSFYLKVTIFTRVLIQRLAFSPAWLVSHSSHGKHHVQFKIFAFVLQYVLFPSLALEFHAFLNQAMDKLAHRTAVPYVRHIFAFWDVIKYKRMEVDRRVTYHNTISKNQTVHYHLKVSIFPTWHHEDHQGFSSSHPFPFSLLVSFTMELRIGMRTFASLLDLQRLHFHRFLWWTQV